MLKRFLFSASIGILAVSFSQVSYGDHNISFILSSSFGKVGTTTNLDGLKGDDHINGRVTFGDNGDSISSSTTLTSKNNSSIDVGAFAKNQDGSKSTSADVSVYGANSSTINTSSSMQNNTYSSSVSGKMTGDGSGQMNAQSYINGNKNAYIEVSNANTASAGASSSIQGNAYVSNASGEVESNNGIGQITANSNVDNTNSHIDIRSVNSATVNVSSGKYNDTYTSSLQVNNFTSSNGNGEMYGNVESKIERKGGSNAWLNKVVNLNTASLTMSSSAQEDEYLSNIKADFESSNGANIINNNTLPAIYTYSHNFEHYGEYTQAYIDDIQNFNKASINISSNAQGKQFSSNIKADFESNSGADIVNNFDNKFPAISAFSGYSVGADYSQAQIGQVTNFNKASINVSSSTQSSNIKDTYFESYNGTGSMQDSEVFSQIIENPLEAHVDNANNFENISLNMSSNIYSSSAHIATIGNVNQYDNLTIGSSIENDSEGKPYKTTISFEHLSQADVTVNATFYPSKAWFNNATGCAKHAYAEASSPFHDPVSKTVDSDIKLKFTASAEASQYSVTANIDNSNCGE